MAEFEDVPEDLIQKWRDAEDKFFGGLPTQQPELYQSGVQLVRALADALEDLISPRELAEVYPERGEEWARERAEAIMSEVPQRLNVNMARNAAFQLRYNEVRPFFLEVGAKLRELKADQADWKTLHEKTGEFTGRAFHRRLDYHPPTRRAVHLHPFLSTGGRYIHVVEVFPLDPETGERDSNGAPLEEPRRFPGPEEGKDAFDEIKGSLLDGEGSGRASK